MGKNRVIQLILTAACLPAALFLFAVAVSVTAQTPNPLTPSADPANTLLHQIGEVFERHSAPGAIVVLVRNGDVVFNEGFGLADVAANRPVDPSGTLIRIGSISKPFTGIGVLNAVEAGLIGLDEDVNSYFDRPVVRDRFSSPVTMRHLLTHTAGFDDRHIGKSARTRDEALPLDQAVRKLLPGRFIESGEIATYSNFGVALAGYVLQEVSGKPFNLVMQEQVFHPLGMHRTTFDPKPADLQHLMTGYFPEAGGITPLPYDYILDAPAGTMVTTGADMARFMIRLLETGGLERAGVLSAAGTAEMMEIRFTHHPDLAGGYGWLWSISEHGGHHLVAHGGGYIGVAARLMFFPENNTALFVAQNTMDFAFIGEVTDLVIREFLPPPVPAPSAPTHPAFDDERGLSPFTGTWRDTRYSRGSFTKFATLIGLMGSEMRTGSLGDSLLTMPSLFGEPRRMRRVGPLLFQSIDDDYMLAFRAEGNRITHVFTSGTQALEKLHPLETRQFQIILMSALMLFFASITLAYPMIGAYRRIRGSRRRMSRIDLYEWIIAALYTFGLLLYAPVFMSVPAYEMMIGFGYGLPGAVRILTLVPFVALGFTAILGVVLIRQGRSVDLRLLRSALIIVCSLALIISLNYWNLVGWRF